MSSAAWAFGWRRSSLVLGGSVRAGDVISGSTSGAGMGGVGRQQRVRGCGDCLAGCEDRRVLPSRRLLHGHALTRAEEVWGTVSLESLPESVMGEDGKLSGCAWVLSSWTLGEGDGGGWMDGCGQVGGMCPGLGIFGHRWLGQVALKAGGAHGPQRGCDCGRCLQRSRADAWAAACSELQLMAMASASGAGRWRRRALDGGVPDGGRALHTCGVLLGWARRGGAGVG